MTPPLLSICIPTYQRRERVIALVGQILASDGPLEVCVHVDGDVDGSCDALKAMAVAEPRLLVSCGPNQGRAKALLSAVRLASGRYVMLYDDDDEIFPDGLDHVLRRLVEPLPPGCCGYVFQMADPNGQVGGAPLPDRSNFLRLRADQGVTGDKKEVVDRAILLANLYRPRRSDRRVPTSTLWSRLALRYDVLGDNTPVGAKDYLQGGYTSQIGKLKAENPWPMVLVNSYRASGLLLGRYRSPLYFFGSVAALLAYSMRALQAGLGALTAPRAPHRTGQERG